MEDFGSIPAEVSGRMVYLAISSALLPLEHTHILACENRFAFSAIFFVH